MNPLDQLFAAWLSDSLTADGGRQLQELLRDPRQRRRWRALADLEGALAECGAATHAEPAEASPVSTERRRRRHHRPRARRRWLYLAAAAALLLLLAGLWLLDQPAAGDLPSRNGQRVARHELVAGPARLLWRDGSRVDVLDGSTARVAEADKGLRLEQGRLDADIAAQQPGAAFVVHSPHASVRVIGTRFSLHCDSRSTTLRVEHGRVAFLAQGADERIIGPGGSAVAGLTPAAVATPAAPGSRGLVGWWPLNEGSGSIAHDRSGQGHDGRIVGAAWTDQGLRFSGGDDRVDIAPNGILAELQAGDYSLAAWYRPERLPSAGDPDDPASTRDRLSLITGRTGWHLGLTLDHRGTFTMQNIFADLGGSYASSTSIATLGRWHHLVGMVDRTHGRTHLAVDGVVVSSTSWPAGTPAYVYDADRPWRIGIGEPDSPDFRWPAVGMIRDVRFYDRVLSEPEMRALALPP